MVTEQGYSVGCSLKSVNYHLIKQKLSFFLFQWLKDKTWHTHIVVQLHCLVGCRAVLILGRVLANPEMNIPS